MQIFDKQGRYLEPDPAAVSALTPEARVALDNVRDAAAASVAADQELQAVRNSIAIMVTEVDAAEDNLRRFRPVMTPHMAIRDHLRSEAITRSARHGL